jgi:hypothetical protein
MFKVYAETPNKGATMTEIQKDTIIRRWNKCDKDTKIRIASDFFKIMRNGELQGDWWHFLDKKLSTFT